MAESDVDGRDGWVRRVLGFEVPAGAGAGAATLGRWQAASQTVDRQLQDLARALQGTGVAVLGELAREVRTLLQTVEGNLEPALQAFDGGADERARKAALDAIGSALGRLRGDARVEAVDTNPFGTRVTMTRTLETALKDLQMTVATTAGASR